TASSRSIFLRTATRQSRTPCSGTGCCGARSRWGWTAKGCARACGATSRRSRPGRSSAAGRSGTPRRGTCRTTRRRPGDRSRGSAGATRTATAAGHSNAGRYANPVFDRLVDEATAAPRRDAAKRLWRRAIETLNQDAPAIFLYAPDNVAAVNRRVTDVVIRPDEYWALVRTWRIPAD